MLRDVAHVAALDDAPDTPSALTRPRFPAWVAAGFSPPADDHLDRDLHEPLIQHPAATDDGRAGATGGHFEASSHRSSSSDVMN
jgi:hypothetical protein